MKRASRDRLLDFSNAASWLTKSVTADRTGEFGWLVRAGTVQIFELCFELGWKALKAILENEKGIVANGPREVIREAFAAEIIIDGELWLNALDDRNATTHTYDEASIEAIALKVESDYARLLSNSAAALAKKYE